MVPPQWSALLPPSFPLFTCSDLLQTSDLLETVSGYGKCDHLVRPWSAEAQAFLKLQHWVLVKHTYSYTLNSSILQEVWPNYSLYTFTGSTFICFPFPAMKYFYVIPSLVPRPHTPTKVWPCIHCSCMREIIGRIYGIRSVNVSVNRLSHMARSSIETVYEYSKRKNYKLDSLQLKWLSNQSGILEEPVIFYPLRL